MTDRSSRRRYLRALGLASVAGLAGCSTDGDGELEVGDTTTGKLGTTLSPTTTARPDVGAQLANGYLADVDGYDGAVASAVAQSRVRILVGADTGGTESAFAPVALRIRTGTTVVWEWTGRGEAHSVISRREGFEDGEHDTAGETYEYTFDEPGLFRYFCGEHRGAERGAIHVVDEAAPTSTEEETTAPPAIDAGEYLANGYLATVNNFDGTVVDRRGQARTTVEVGSDGGFGFGPPAVRVDPEATVVWEWAADSGAHILRGIDREFDSGDAVVEGGYTFGQTFDEAGIYRYYCLPHTALGAHGAVVVGGDRDLDVPSRPPRPAVDEYLSGANGWDGTVEYRRTPSVTVDVGAGDGLAFEPVAVRVPKGTLVEFRWTGQGGSHRVRSVGDRISDRPARSEAGPAFGIVATEDGLIEYYCEIHRDVGMRGVIAVGGGYPTAE
jgi:halocyanin-like protein